MLLIYSKKDFNCLVELFIQNKTILISRYNKYKGGKINKIISKIIGYLDYLGYISSSNYKIKIYVYKNKSYNIKSMAITKKI